MKKCSFIKNNYTFSYNLLGDTMSNTVFAFLLTIIAGFSTMLGSIFIFFKMKKKKQMISTSLSFAAGVMITVSFIDLIPEANKLLNTIFQPFPAFFMVLIFIAVVILCSIFIDELLPVEQEKKSRGLYRIGIFSMIAIILHNIPEGIATFMATHENLSLGISLALAITFHNIPEGISISIPIYYSTKSKRKALLYTFISSISEPFGALIAFLFLSPFINDFILGILFSIIAGIMLHIACYELIPEVLKNQNKKTSFLFFLIGILFMMFSNFL